jgi:pimeloyl-ACP methyl ester carboxylesterase
MGIPIPDDRRYDTEYMLREAMKHPIKWGPLKDIPARWTTDHIFELYSNTTILKDALEIGALTIDQIETIRVPVHLVYDRGSTLWRQAYRHLNRSLPNVTSTLLHTGSKEIAHFSPLEKPEVITEQILLAITRDGKACERSSPAGKRSRTRPRFA